MLTLCLTEGDRRGRTPVLSRSWLGGEGNRWLLDQCSSEDSGKLPSAVPPRRHLPSFRTYTSSYAENYEPATREMGLDAEHDGSHLLDIDNVSDAPYWLAGIPERPYRPCKPNAV